MRAVYTLQAAAAISVPASHSYPRHYKRTIWPLQLNGPVTGGSGTNLTGLRRLILQHAQPVSRWSLLGLIENSIHNMDHTNQSKTLSIINKTL
jgi:hypothetical protein